MKEITELKDKELDKCKKEFYCSPFEEFSEKYTFNGHKPLVLQTGKYLGSLSTEKLKEGENED